ncbi:MAG: class I SAM-dependent methyltransferase [Parachlamydiaceae bacterium]
MNFVKFTCALILFASSSLLNAEWNPKYLPVENQSVLGRLKNPSLIQLENQVFESVKNSWCSEEKAKLLMELVVLTQPGVCVEIGAFTGSSSLPLLAALKHVGSGRAYIIDAWSNAEAVRGLTTEDPNTVWWAGLDMKAVKNQFLHMLNLWSLTSYCKILSTTSQKAVLRIPTIDFIHIDGNFSAEGALLDSELYLPKVVPGGYVLLSNALVMIGGKPTKMKALWPIFDQCDIVCELEYGNTLLFRKKL